MIRKFHEAKSGGKPEVDLWGTGKPRREFLFVDDSKIEALGWKAKTGLKEGIGVTYEAFVKQGL